MIQSKLKIFVSAYACEPNLGSEIGVGWHWVLEMSKYFDLWVLTRKSNQSTIEKWLSKHPIQNKIHFLYFDLPKKLRFWKKGLRGVRTYYTIWLWCTNAIVKRTMRKNNIKLFHHLTYGNALLPVSSFGQKQFFVWGPIGGVDSIPYDYSKHYSSKSRIIESIRRLMVKTLALNLGFNQRCKNAQLIFCKSQSIYEQIPKKYRHKAMLFTDVAVEPKDVTKFVAPTLKKDSSAIKYLSVGRLDAWRGFDLLIEAFSGAVKQNSQIQLEILGKGSDKKRLKAIIQQLDINSHVTMTGQVSMEEYYSKLANCDVVVNPCLKEGAVTTAFDSLSFGKPLIGIDTGGYTQYFKDDYSIIIPRNSRIEVVNNLTAAILELTNNELRKQFSLKSLDVSRFNTWENKGQKIYKAIIEKYAE
jgi:glycosyltransferase involved in cell wall biosynthesis